MIDNPDKVKNTIKLYEKCRNKDRIKTILQEMIGENEVRVKIFKDA